MGKVIKRRKRVPYDHQFRNVRIYLPDDYLLDTNKRYDVLYMHDGQNLFFDKEAYDGCSWGIYDYLNLLEVTSAFSDLIVVGIDNAGLGRMNEYAPFYLKKEPLYEEEMITEPLGQTYARWLVKKVKPFIDQSYRTKPQADHTFLAGSSAGANITLYMALHYQEIFSKFGIFSLADWIFDDSLFDDVSFTESFFFHQYFVYTGANEGYGTGMSGVGQAYIDSSLKLGYNLLKAGLPLDQVRIIIKADQPHHESAWRAVFPEFLSFLYDK